MMQPTPGNPNETNKYFNSEADTFDPFQDEMDIYLDQPYYDSQSQSFLYQDPETQEFKPIPDQDKVDQGMLAQTIATNQKFKQFIETQSEEPQKVPTTLKSALESLMNTIPQKNPEPEDRSEVLPTVQAIPIGEAWFFKDAAFAKSFLCTVTQTPRPWMLDGYIILPAKQLSRIRSGPSNHQQATSCLWIPNFPYADCNPFEKNE